MKPTLAWGLLLALALLTAAALVAPWPVAAMILAVSLAMSRKRSGLLLFVASSVVINGLLLAFLRPTGAALPLGPVTLGLDGALLGVVAAIRLSAALALNVATFSRIMPARVVDSLHLPPRWTAFMAAVLIAGQDLARDYAGLRDARKSLDEWPSTRLGSIRAAMGILPMLMVLAVRRAETRQDALRLAGIRTSARFAPIVAVTALGVAGRLAFVGLPNVALTYVVVFLGGMVFGARVGALAGFWSMVFSNFFLTGLLPSAFANAPAMALIGLLGGLIRPLDVSGANTMDRWTGRILASIIGFVGTLLFSATSDALEWVLVPELRGGADILVARIIAGWIFNILPAVLNAVLFAATVVPIHGAFRALESGEKGHEASNRVAST